MAKNARRGSMGGGKSREVSEAQHDDAIRVLDREYLDGVRGIADELYERIKDGDIRSDEDWENAIDQAVDGSYWVIYTHANKQVLFLSDNADAYFDMGFGEPAGDEEGINWAKLAFFAMKADVLRLLDQQGVAHPWEG